MHRPDFGRRPNIGRDRDAALARCAYSFVTIERALRARPVMMSGAARWLPTPCRRSTDRGHDMTAPCGPADRERDAEGSCVNPEARIEALERRVDERTSQLMRAVEALREA